MWIFYAFFSAIFAGITSIFGKIGIKKTNSHLAIAIRTVIILIFSWSIVFIGGLEAELADISTKSLVFLILSGCTTGGAWICYFKALQLGDINKVVPIDKSSTILTMILAFILLDERITIYMLIGMILIGIGTFLMIQKKENAKEAVKGSKWFLYAVFSAVFSSMTAILGKIGVENVNSNLATAIRTVVILMLAWGIVFGLKKQSEVKHIDKKSWVFIILSGFTTGFSWLFYYRALKDGQASIVAPIDKMSLLVSIGFAYFIFKEKLSKKASFGLALLTIGTLTLLIK
jgi:Predicted membrane protein